MEEGGEGGRRNIIMGSAVDGVEGDGDTVIMAVIHIEVIVMETTTTPGTTIQHGDFMIGEEAIADQASHPVQAVPLQVRAERAESKYRLL